MNWTLAVITGLLWYGQFFFYNLGHVRMGHYRFTSWAIHMTMLVLPGNLVGVVLREWRGRRGLTHTTVRRPIRLGLSDSAYPTLCLSDSASILPNQAISDRAGLDSAVVFS